MHRVVGGTVTRCSRSHVLSSTHRHVSIFDVSDYWTSKRRAEWNNVGVIKTKGRLNAFNNYPHSWEIIPSTVATSFPSIECTNLLNEQVTLPAASTPPRKAKLVVFAFKQYGMGLLPAYYTSFLEKYHGNPHVELIEICFVEHKFLSLLRGLFISGLRKQISQDRHANTGYVFGGIMVGCLLYYLCIPLLLY